MDIMGEVTLFLKEKRCRDVSDCSVFGCLAQEYAAARLPAVAEYSGAVVAVLLCARLRTLGDLHRFSQSCHRE